MWSKNDLVRMLKEIGLKQGDTVLVHSSIRSVGEVEGRADAILDALQETVTAEGLLVLPTHTWAYINQENPVFSVTDSPSCVGKLPEIFRHRPDTVRSLHPTHSVAAWGKDAAAYCAGHERFTTPCAWDSPWGRLAQRKGKILMLGSPAARNTFIHGVEEWAGIPNRLTEAMEPLVAVTENGARIEVPSHRHMGDVSVNYGKVEPAALYKGIETTGKVGDAFCRLFDADGLRRLVTDFLKRDPDLFADDRPIPEEWYMGGSR